MGQRSGWVSNKQPKEQISEVPTIYIQVRMVVHVCALAEAWLSDQLEKSFTVYAKGFKSIPKSRGVMFAW